MVPPRIDTFLSFLQKTLPERSLKRHDSFFSLVKILRMSIVNGTTIERKRMHVKRNCLVIISTIIEKNPIRRY